VGEGRTGESELQTTDSLFRIGTKKMTIKHEGGRGKEEKKDGKGIFTGAKRRKGGAS